MASTRTKSSIQQSVVDQVIQVLAMLPDRGLGDHSPSADSTNYLPITKRPLVK